MTVYDIGVDDKNQAYFTMKGAVLTVYWEQVMSGPPQPVGIAFADATFLSSSSRKENLDVETGVMCY